MNAAVKRLKAINVIYAGLYSDSSRKAVDAVNAFTRAQMFLPFTGMPRRGLFRRMLPPVTVYPVDELERRHWPYDKNNVTVVDGVPHAPNLMDTGVLYYEITEEILHKEDYEKRLRARRVGKWEWHEVQKTRRTLLRLHKLCPKETPTTEDKYKFFIAVMVRLRAQILSMHS